jgi:hypothetical protein
MNKPLWVYSVWVSLLSAIFFFLYGLTGMTIGWIMFVMLAVFFGMGSKVKDVIPCICCVIAGLIWGQLDLVCDGLLVSAGLPAALAMFISIAVMTTITMGIHLTVLGKTWLNKLPFIFAAVALTFSQGGKNEFALTVTLIGGLVLALCCALGEGYIFSHFGAPAQADNEVDAAKDAAK